MDASEAGAATSLGSAPPTPPQQAPVVRGGRSGAMKTARAAGAREGQNNSNHKICEEEALAVWRCLCKGHTAQQAADVFGVSVHIVRSIKYGKRWTHVTGLTPRGRKRRSSSEEPSGNKRLSQSSSTSLSSSGASGSRRRRVRRAHHDGDDDSAIDAAAAGAHESDVDSDAECSETAPPRRRRSVRRSAKRGFGADFVVTDGACDADSVSSGASSDGTESEDVEIDDAGVNASFVVSPQTTSAGAGGALVCPQGSASWPVDEVPMSCGAAQAKHERWLRAALQEQDAQQRRALQGAGVVEALHQRAPDFLRSASALELCAVRVLGERFPVF